MLSDAGMQSDDEIDISEVIDWDEAMEQVAGDEEFLLELLNDLQEELSAQIIKISIAMVSLSRLNPPQKFNVHSTQSANPVVTTLLFKPLLLVESCATVEY
jgi:hypothetical protein